MQPTIRALRYFVAAAEAEGVTLAAQRLNVSQPSISEAIRQLETGFGFRIFVRHHARGLSLTHAGVRLLSEARSLLAQYEQFCSHAGALGTELRGRIAIGCFLTLVPIFMPELMSSFRKRYPGIEVSVFEANQEEILAGLRSGTLECAITFDYGLSGDVLIDVVAELPPNAVLPHDHPLAAQDSIPLSALQQESFILLDLPHTRDYFLSLFRSAGVEPRIGYYTKSYEVVRGLAARGEGYSILNTLPRTSETYDGGRVAMVPLAGNPQATRIAIVRLPEGTLRNATAAFVNHLREHLQIRGEHTAGR